MMSVSSNLYSEMQDYAKQHHVPIISQAGADLLGDVVRKRNPKSILEIGTAIGYSTLIMAMNTAADAKIVTIELDRERAETAQRYFHRAGVENKVKVLVGDAGQIVPELTGIFDLVFIDAAKGQYLDYLHKVLNHLSGNSVVVADNVLFRGLVEGDELPPRRYRTIVRRLREYLEFVSSHPKFKTTIHRVGDGVAISYFLL